MAYTATPDAPTRLMATATANGVVEHAPIQPDWHDELQSFLRERATVNLAGMTRRTASSLCG